MLVEVKVDKPIFRYIWATFPLLDLISYFLTNSSVNNTSSDTYNILIAPIWNLQTAVQLQQAIVGSIFVVCGFIPSLRWVYTYGRWYYFVVELYDALLIELAKGSEEVLTVVPGLISGNEYSGLAVASSTLGIIGTIVVAIMGKPGKTYVLEEIPVNHSATL